MSKHASPPGFGPELASAGGVPESERVLTVLTLGGVAVVFALFEGLRGLDWRWSISLAVLLFAALYVANFKLFMRAGRGWFARNNGFVRTDSLIELRARIILSGTFVRMTDSEGRTADGPLSELTKNPKIWHLVLAGVRESVSRGLLVEDKRTADIFGLPLRPRDKPHDLEDEADPGLADVNGNVILSHRAPNQNE